MKYLDGARADRLDKPTACVNIVLRARGDSFMFPILRAFFSFSPRQG